MKCSTLFIKDNQLNVTRYSENKFEAIEKFPASTIWIGMIGKQSFTFTKRNELTSFIVNFILNEDVTISLAG